MEQEKTKKSEIKEEDIARIRDILSDIRYGSVTIVVQDGKLIQIEKNEKLRLK